VREPDIQIPVAEAQVSQFVQVLYTILVITIGPIY